jgi:prolyl oligopeptidase
MRRFVLAALHTALALTIAIPASGQRPPAPRPADDPFIWLEEVDGTRAMDWVKAKNSATLDELGKSPLYQPIFERTKQVLDSRDRIASPTILGDRIYNFWQDAQHERGIWRRTTWESYLTSEPAWETVIDLDSLAKADSVPWAWGGADCLEPAYRRCMVSLSRGGSDAAEVREFDLTNGRFVEDGFKLAEAKSSLSWVDENTLLIGTNFGPGTMTTSGYARIIKQWKRGTPLSAATTVHEIPATDLGVFAFSSDAGPRRYVRLQSAKDFYTYDALIVTDGRARKLDVQQDADVYFVGDQMVVYVRTPWEVGGAQWDPGSLIATPVDAFMGGSRTFTLVMNPGEREAIDGISSTRDHLLLNVLDNVSGQLRRYRPGPTGWTYDVVPAPTLGAIGVSATSRHDNRFFFTYTSFIQPTTLYLAEASGPVREVKRLPAMFDATGLKVEQLEARSKDGTRIPFYVVSRDGLPRDGTNPTLLYAYGGFESSTKPSYSTTIGANWLERGGVFVSANIRGGGEFGPSWHRAGLKENRQRIYDDFIAVAEELIRLKITSPSNLGIMGGSNGGLLMGVNLTQRPDLYNAIVIQVPLLDMRRYNQLLAGASWMAEYGNPDKPEEWEYISKYSPYQNVKPGQKYPRVLFTTTTRDDRVHPGHARKMAAKMESMGYPFYYFENTEGGHGSGVTSDQRARTIALTYTYLWQQLTRKSAS